MKLIGKATSMVTACIECKPVQLGIGKELQVVSNVVQYGLITYRHCKDLQAKMEHPYVRVLGGPN